MTKPSMCQHRKARSAREGRGGTLEAADYGYAMGALPTLLLTGAPGSGKTAIAKEIGERLRRASVRYAVVDLFPPKP
jgi:Cdc6-like AAA superfamily ATPase